VQAVAAAKSELPSSDDAAVSMQTETSEHAGLIETNVADGEIKGELPPAPNPGKKRRRRKSRNKAKA